MERLASFIETLLRGIGRATAWLNLLLVLVILIQVIMRYFFHHALVPLEELLWHLYAAAFMIGLSYGLVTDQHIRVDLLRERFSPRVTAAIEIFGLLFLVLPLVVVVFDHSLHWLALSWQLDEGSSSPAGLPNRWIIKAVIPLAMALLGLAALARLIRQWQRLFEAK